MVEIKNIIEALNYAQKIIGKYEKINRVDKDFGEKGLRGALIYTEKNTYCVRFKNNLYGTFSYKEERDGERIFITGIAEAKTSLYVCRGNGFIPLLILNDGRIYFFPADQWIEWCEERAYDTQVIRPPKNREKEVDNWTYYNIPITFLKNYEKEQEQNTNEIRKTI